MVNKILSEHERKSKKNKQINKWKPKKSSPQTTKIKAGINADNE